MELHKVVGNLDNSGSPLTRRHSHVRPAQEVAHDKDSPRNLAQTIVPIWFVMKTYC